MEEEYGMTTAQKHISCSTHCCPRHGCKYGHDDCPVFDGKVAPEYPPDNGCEQCEYEETEYPEIQHLKFVSQVLDFFSKNDVTEDLMWSVDHNLVRFSAQCSDVFHWASADSEDIGPDDLPLLQQCIDDLRATEIDAAVVYTAELYAARKRGMRPMRKWFDAVIDGSRTERLLSRALDGPRNERFRELFLAAGPERTRESEG
jgi:hypothetical protein